LTLSSHESDDFVADIRKAKLLSFPLLEGFEDDPIG
jgi:hypothetical protein